MAGDLVQLVAASRPKRSGRPKGAIAKTKKEAREICRSLVEDKVYQRHLLNRLRRGDLGPMEPILWQYAYGKPATDLTVQYDLSQLSDEELAALATITPKISHG